MSNEIKQGDIVVFKTGNRAFEVIGKYIVPDDRLWRVDAITENDPQTPDRNRKYRLVAVDCPNVMLDEIPEIYVESYSEKLERELEEQRKEALKMNRNEIKRGDKVRVSKDAPKLIFGSCDMSQIVCTVCCVDKDVAAINVINDERTEMKVWIVPTKYLVKIDAEAKEAKYKAGDKVRVKGSVLLEGGVFSVIGADYHEKLGWQYELNIHEWYPEIDLELYTEPTEQTEEEKKPNVGSITIPVEVDLSDSYWDAYAADLAKEVALKVANKKMDNHPKEIGAYAVKVAKAVVEGLKRK